MASTIRRETKSLVSSIASSGDVRHERWEISPTSPPSEQRWQIDLGESRGQIAKETFHRVYYEEPAELSMAAIPTTARASQEKSMKKTALRTISSTSFALIAALAVAWQAHAQQAKTPYPNMAPPEQYAMERTAEIALARTAAPESISQDAEVMVLGQHGYETAVNGKNGFVCIVERSWTAGTDDPDFWNSKVRSPICFNPPAARSQIPVTLKKTEVILASRSKTQMAEAIKAAFASKELATPESGSMCYMMSKQQYLSDRDRQWHPHLMFFVPLTESATWGANLPGSPVIGMKDAPGQLTLFLIPVGHWSDGSAAPEE
jgi:hypothetical protein